MSPSHAPAASRRTRGWRWRGAGAALIAGPWLALAGCGTLFNNTRMMGDNIRQCRFTSYGGTWLDAGVAGTGLFEDASGRVVGDAGDGQPAFVLDLPFSAVADTVVLPINALTDLYIFYLRYNHVVLGPNAPGRVAVCPDDPDAPHRIALTHFGPATAPATPQQCADAHGQWRVLSQTGLGTSTSVCALPTGDGGKACADTRDCQGFCLAPPGTAAGRAVAGQCAASYQADCFQYVFGGRAQPRLCLRDGQVRVDAPPAGPGRAPAAGR